MSRFTASVTIENTTDYSMSYDPDDSQFRNLVWKTKPTDVAAGGTSTFVAAWQKSDGGPLGFTILYAWDGNPVLIAYDHGTGFHAEILLAHREVLTVKTDTTANAVTATIKFTGIQ